MSEDAGIHITNDSNEENHNTMNANSEPLIQEPELRTLNLDEALTFQNEDIIYTETVQPVHEKEIPTTNVFQNVPQSQIEKVPLQRNKRYAIV